MHYLIVLFLMMSNASSQVPWEKVNEQSFLSVVSKIEGLYSPYFELAGHHLKFTLRWESEEKSCFTTYQNPPTFLITLNGGAFRNKIMNNDGLAFVVCHEIGHAIGGHPKYMSDVFWGSAESQADYFATNVCLKKVFKDDNNAAAVEGLKVPKDVKKLCKDNALCVRSIMAATVFAEYTRQAKISQYPKPVDPLKRDSTVVTVLNRSYAAPQCRLDTAVAGSLCARGESFDLNTVGDAKDWNCRAPDASNMLRPACWFMEPRSSLISNF